MPSVRQRRIGTALRKAREANRLTLSAAARRYGRSQGWMSTVENGLQAITPQELADLLNFYRVPPGPLRDSLLHLAAHNPGKNWDHAYEGRVSPAALDLASLEEDAALIRNFEPCVVPGLCQEPAYTEGLIAAGHPDSVRNTTALVEFRLARQEVLGRPDPPRYVPIISESVLRHQVGDEAVMRAQIRRLARTAQRENVELHILPDSAGALLWLAGPFHLLSLRPPGRLTVSVVEQFTRNRFVEDEGEVAAHEEIFNRLLAASLNESSSLQLIERIASET